MINSRHLLKESKKLLSVLEEDIRERLEELPELDAQLQAEWNAARAAKRTAGAYLDWREENITQSAVHWILACVFLRFLEDNGFLARVCLTSADADARATARDYYESYFRANPNHSDLEYLLHSFRDVAQLPGLKGLYDSQHNPLFRLPLSGDGGMALLAFWRKVDPESGVLVHDFTDPARGTRFLGDLYQDLSEAARDRYALLQTPDFVEEFILDRTLTSAIDIFGYKHVRLIDPTCGSGHFLLGAFHRLFTLWGSKQPARNLPDLAQQALNGVYGVDLNPFAVEIARFRLLIAALTASDVHKLKDAPDFRINLAAGDSLLHGPRFGLRGTAGMFEDKEDYAGTGLAHAYQTEDLPELQRILGQQYHVVVGNPPYPTPSDSALRSIYRERYLTCYKKYSLGVPFTERFFELVRPSDEVATAGYVGLITASSFMKREFGQKLIEDFLPTVDVTHVIDTSFAYIPGHGTSTVILFGRHRHPVADTIRTVMGIRGESTTPSDPAQGRAWLAIRDQVDQPGSESSFVTVVDTDRNAFAKHPWSIGGGGAADLKESIESNSVAPLRSCIAVRRTTTFVGDRQTDRESLEIGFASFPGQDEVFLRPNNSFCRSNVEPAIVRPVITGDVVRDWQIVPHETALTPYNEQGRIIHLQRDAPWARDLWRFRTVLSNVTSFGGKTKEDLGYAWWGWYRWIHERYRSPLTITFGEVATHNHFALDRGGGVFNRTAPVIKLREEASIADHLGLLGLLNSSVACFWLKQVCTPKGGDQVGQQGARVRKTLWDERYAFNSSNIADFPLASEHPTDLTVELDKLARQRTALLRSCLVLTESRTRTTLDDSCKSSNSLRKQMIALQEELDWRCYALYKLTSESLECPNPPEINVGERAFEIHLARRVVSGEEETTWFDRHGAKRTAELPAHWPNDYRTIVERRIALIESDRNIGLIERPEYKRRWNTEPWEEQEQRAIRDWLLDRVETERYWPGSGVLQLRSVFQLSDAARNDPDFIQVATLYTGRDDFDVRKLVGELVESEAVPFLAACRYTDDGLRKRQAWEQTWTLQRQEDAVDERIAAAMPRKPDESDDEYRKRLAAVQGAARVEEVGEVPVPPKYKSSDFRPGAYWSLRGALDVPKERFVSYPGATPDADGTLLLGWAGWDHLQQATALAGHYIQMKENEGWEAPRLIPLLAGLLELAPWLKQWHNEWNAEHDARMGDYFEGFVQDEARALGASLESLRAWRPDLTVRRGRKKA